MIRKIGTFAATALVLGACSDDGGRGDASATSGPTSITTITAGITATTGSDESGGTGTGGSGSAGVSATEPTGGSTGALTSSTGGGCLGDDECAPGQTCEAGQCVDGVTCTADNVGVGDCLCAPGAVEPCYDGPPNTQGVGICVGGQRTCDASGTFWGACEGSVTPSGEACGNGVDDDCDGATDEDLDADGDGFTVCGGDCCDEDGLGCEKAKLVNPGAFDVAGNGLDDDCDGVRDNQAPPCDGALALASADPLDGARAMDLCKVSQGATDWGIVSAKYVTPDGGPPPNGNFSLGHGILNAFGPNVAPKKGAQFLGLSSGTARQPSDPGYQSPGGFDKQYTSGHPPGFPKESPACPGVFTGQPHDGAALELQVRVPTNAYGFSFDFTFYTFEWPSWVCSQYNDFFVALLDPIPMGQTDGNVAFDMQKNPVSVNNAFVEVCGCGNGPPCQAGPKQYSCSLGTAELIGTGFEGHAATSWLTTTAPVPPGGLMTLRLGVYDSGDGVLDSSAILDNFRWEIDPNTKVETIPQ